MNKHAWVLTINNPIASDLLVNLEPLKKYITFGKDKQFSGDYRNPYEAYDKKVFKTQQPELFKNDIIYIIYGKEVAPETLTIHYQMCVVFSRKKSFKKVKEIFPRAHIEPMRGSLQQNKNYCHKANKHITVGSFLLALKYVALDAVETSASTKNPLPDEVALTNKINSLERKLDDLTKLLKLLIIITRAKKQT